MRRFTCASFCVALHAPVFTVTLFYLVLKKISRASLYVRQLLRRLTCASFYSNVVLFGVEENVISFFEQQKTSISTKIIKCDSIIFFFIVLFFVRWMYAKFILMTFNSIYFSQYKRKYMTRAQKGDIVMRILKWQVRRCFIF